MRLALGRPGRAALGEQAFDPAHRRAEILGRARPTRRKYPGGAVQRVDRQSGIIGEGGKLRGFRGRHGFDPCVVAKRVASLVRLVEPKRCGRDCLNAVRRQQLSHLGQLAWIVARDHQLACDSTMHVLFDLSPKFGLEGATANHATAIFCKSTSRATPLLANAIRARNSSCENGVFSAVPCTSMIRPSPVITKLASVSASESSA